MVETEMTLGSFLDAGDLSTGVLGKTMRRKRNGWPAIQGEDIKEWFSFTENNLCNRFHTLLRSSFDTTTIRQVLATLRTVRGQGLVGLTSEEYMARQYAEATVPALEHAMRTLGETARITHWMPSCPERNLQDVPIDAKLSGMDFYIVLDNKDLAGLIVGLFRSEKQVTGSQLMQGAGLLQNQLYSMQQLASLYRKARTHYGFVHFDSHLVLCHFLEDFQQVEIKLVLAKVDEELTTQKAIFYLCMMAANDKLQLRL